MIARKRNKISIELEKQLINNEWDKIMKRIHVHLPGIKFDPTGKEEWGHIAFEMERLNTFDRKLIEIGRRDLLV